MNTNHCHFSDITVHKAGLEYFYFMDSVLLIIIFLVITYWEAKGERELLLAIRLHDNII